MRELIQENKFEELKEMLQNTNSEFKIHDVLQQILNNKKIEPSNFDFNAKKYQEEFLEGFDLFKVLEKSNISENQLQEFTNLLSFIVFEMGAFIHLLSNTALQKGVYLSEVQDLFKVNPTLRSKLQEFIEILKVRKDFRTIANVSAAKYQVSNAISNLLNRYEVGNDMIQFGKGYEQVGEKNKAIHIYNAVMIDFECESVKSSSGLFPDISQVDTRPKEEIKIYEKAKEHFENLTGENIQEIKRIHIDDNINAKKLAEESEKLAEESIKENFNSEENESISFFERIMKIFKKN